MLTAAQIEHRLTILQSSGILDTPPEAQFDDLTRVASFICKTPISLISLLDEKRQWFKSRVGLEAKETPRRWRFNSRTGKCLMLRSPWARPFV